jgi:hypothetical protein
MRSSLRTALLVLAGALCLALPAAAPAADQIFWTDYTNGTVGRADLAGGNGATFAGLGGPYGIAVDAAAGKLYVGEYDADRVSSLNLDGSGLAPVYADADVVDASWGMSFDPLSGRLFWASDSGASNDKLSSVKTDGTGGGVFLGGVPQLDDPVSPVVDPLGNRIYWVNYAGASLNVGFADLATGANPGTITLSGDCTAQPFTAVYTVAVDPARGRLIVGGLRSGTPARARAVVAALDGSGCTAILDEIVGSGSGVEGVALDTDTGKVYLAAPPKILVHTLGTPGATELDVSPATPAYTSYPALLKTPAGTAAVTPSAAQVGATLTCSAQWSIGTPSASLYRSPSSATTFAWTRDGADIAGANAATYAPGAPGAYACRATASNGAGAGSATSPSVAVTAPPAAAPPLTPAPAGAARLTISVRASTSKLKRSGKVTLRIRTTNTGTIAATKVKVCLKAPKAFRLSGRKAKACATRSSLAAGASSTRSISVTAGRKPGTFRIGATAEAANAAKVSVSNQRRATLRVR